MPHTFIPEGSVVLSREDYDKLSSKAKELQSIQLRQAEDKRQALMVAAHCGHRAIFRTRDGLVAEDRITATGRLQRIDRPLKTKVSVQYAPGGDFSPTSPSRCRNYRLKEYDHGHQAFVYEEHEAD